jgi:uncharacterized protein GlcG (DUF336 family)
MSFHGVRNRARLQRTRQKLAFDVLDRRDLPALVASQQVLAPPLLTPAEVTALLSRAAAATASDDAIVAVVDRNGTILGVRVEGGVNATFQTPGALQDFAIDGAVAEARTAAMFANDTAPLTSRTIQEISQTTITQREVESDPNLAAVAATSPTYGPGFVAPINTGGHFPPNIPNTPAVDLFGIEHTNRDSYVSNGVGFATRFDVDAADVPAGQADPAPISYGQSLLPAYSGVGPVTGTQADPALASLYQSRGIGTLPGGIPLYQYGTLVGGIGVFFPGSTGYADAENSILSTNYNPALPDLSTEAEFIAVAAAGGSKQAGVVVGTLGGVPALPGFDIPFPRIDLGGITLDTIGPGGLQGPQNLLAYAKANYNIGGGNANSGTDVPVNSGGATALGGAQVPTGWLVTPHASAFAGGLTAAQVTQIINQGIATANTTRAQIRTPDDNTARMVFAVADENGNILGLYRMPDATTFSIDVAVAKARNDAYYDSNQLVPQDELPGVPVGTSFSNRTFRYLAAPRYPISVQGAPPGYFSSLNDPNISQVTALQTGPALPASAYNSILLHDSFNPNSNFHDPNNPQYQNGIVFFPGSAGVYVNNSLLGGFGVSGDGVDQDDFVTSGGIVGYDAPESLKAYNVVFQNVRLPFRKDPRNPTRD